MTARHAPFNLPQDLDRVHLQRIQRGPVRYPRR